MGKSPMDVLTERLERLEIECGRLRRDNRRWKQGGVAAVLVVAAVALLGAGAAKIVETEKLVIRDKGGQVRASLQVDADGQVKLSLLDEKGNSGVELGADEEASGITVGNSRGRTEIQLAATRHEAGTLTMTTGGGGHLTLITSGAGENNAEIRLQKIDEGPRIWLMAHDGKFGQLKMIGGKGTEGHDRPDIVVSSGDDGSADLTVHGAKYDTRLELGTDKAGDPFLRLWGQDKKPIFAAPPK